MSKNVIIGNKNSSNFKQRELESKKSEYNFFERNKKIPIYGTIKGISSNEKGYSGSRYDLFRNCLKFIVDFPELEGHRFVIPDKPPEYYYTTFGINEEAYVGLPVVCYVNEMNIPNSLKGDISIGNIEKIKMNQVKYLNENNEEDYNSMLVIERNRMVESAGFFTGTFSGIFDAANKFLLNKIAKSDNDV